MVLLCSQRDDSTGVILEGCGMGARVCQGLVVRIFIEIEYCLFMRIRFVSRESEPEDNDDIGGSVDMLRQQAYKCSA
jgi:hypothetical protein